MKTRFAPSPTGHLHIGGARTALFCYLAAKSTNGEFILRFEDTDLQRSQARYEKSILASLEWLGVIPDWIVKQSDRVPLYHGAVEELLAFGYAYHCDCSQERLETLRERQKQNNETPRYDNHCRSLNIPQSDSTVVRFNLSASISVQKLTYSDLIHGDLSVDVDELDDFVLCRSAETYGSSDGFTYNFCAAIDDHDLKIDTIVRGDDHMRNTFRQIAINQSLRHDIAKFCHLPMVHNLQGQRLSKRDGAANILDFADMGIHSEALVDYLVRLGWSAGDQEYFGMNQLRSVFNLQDVAKSPAKFDLKKLQSVSAYYLKTMSSAQLHSSLYAYASSKDHREDATGTHRSKLDEMATIFGEKRFTAAIELLAERTSNFSDLFHQLNKLLLLPSGSTDSSNTASLQPHIQNALNLLTQALKKLDIQEWEEGAIEAAFKQAINQNNLKYPELAMPVRNLLFGEPKGPSVSKLAVCLGRSKTIQRLEV